MQPPPSAQRSDLVLSPRYPKACRDPFQIPEENYLGPDFDPEQHFLVVTSSATSSLPPSWSLSRPSLPSSLSWPCGPLYEHLLIDLRTPCIDVRNIATIARKQIDTTRVKFVVELLAGGTRPRASPSLHAGVAITVPRSGALLAGLATAVGPASRQAAALC